MNFHCKICNSVFGVIPDTSCTNFYFKEINKEVISERYICQDCQATYTYNSKTNRWEYDNNSKYNKKYLKEI